MSNCNQCNKPVATGLYGEYCVSTDEAREYCSSACLYLGESLSTGSTVCQVCGKAGHSACGGTPGFDAVLKLWTADVPRET